MDPSPALPSHQEPAPEWHGKIVSESVEIEDRAFLIEHPAPDASMAGSDHPPCWAELWPAARMLAKAILSEAWTPGTDALEIGCGLGLPGIVALSMGLRVTFSDCDPLALRFAAANARLNGFGDFQTLQMDWRYPPIGLQPAVVLASDPVFEVQHVDSLVNFVKQVLPPGGVCLMTEQQRVASGALREALGNSGLAVTAWVVRDVDVQRRRVKGTLYRITQAVPS